jgi:hypothetical protein
MPQRHEKTFRALVILYKNMLIIQALVKNSTVDKA